MLPRRSFVATLDQASPIFAALGDQTRLALVGRLCIEGPLSITELTVGSTVTRQAISKHLTVLASAGLVHDVHRGREHIWELDIGRVQEARAYLDGISRQWDNAIERLRQFVEEND